GVYPYLYHHPDHCHHGVHTHWLFHHHRDRHWRRPDPHYHLHLHGDGAPTCLLLLPEQQRRSVGRAGGHCPQPPHRYSALRDISVRLLLRLGATRFPYSTLLRPGVYPYLYYHPHAGHHDIHAHRLFHHHCDRQRHRRSDPHHELYLDGDGPATCF